MPRQRINARFSLRRFALAATCTLLLAAPLIYAARAFAEVTRSMPAETLQAIQNPKLVVLKHDRIVHLFDGENLVRSYPCDLGSSPIGDKRRIDDEKTPTGQFKIVSKNQHSPYRRFLGLNYPHRRAVEEGQAAGLISDGAASSILNALSESRCPDWSTALGGGIGIHGQRKGRDWTGGCVAVSNDAIDELFEILRIGDRVEVLP